MDARRIATIAWTIGIIWFLVFIIFFLIIPGINEREKFIKDEYFGVINAVERRPGHRGHAHILLNGNWKLLNTNEMKIGSYIKPGDSIVKAKGRQVITIYRRDIKGSKVKKEFK